MGKCIERRFFKASAAAQRVSSKNRVHNSKKADDSEKIKETLGKPIENSVCHLVGQSSTQYDLSLKPNQKDQIKSPVVRVTIDQLKVEVASEHIKKEAMLRKMNNQEKTLLSLF